MTSTIKADVVTAQTTNGNVTLQGNGSGTVAIGDNTAITGTLSATGAATLSSQAYPTAGGLWTGRNLIINGEMKVSQRGTQTGISANTYTTDRWQLQAAGAGRSTVSVSTEVPNNNFVVSAKIDVTTADTSIGATDLQVFTQRLEGTTIARLGLGTASAKAFSVSFWVRSTKTGTFCVSIRNPSGTRSIASEYTISSSNTWEHKKINFAGDTTGTYNTNTSEGFGVNFVLLAGTDYDDKTADTWEANTDFSTANQVNAFDSTSNEFYITGIQLEAGESTPFEHELLSETLQKCQRYFTKIAPKVNAVTVRGYNASGAVIASRFQFATRMRAEPTCSIAGTWTVSNCGQPSFVSFDDSGFTLGAVTSSAADTYFYPDGTDDYLTASAEL